MITAWTTVGAVELVRNQIVKLWNYSENKSIEFTDGLHTDSGKEESRVVPRILA